MPMPMASAIGSSTQDGLGTSSLSVSTIPTNADIIDLKEDISHAIHAHRYELALLDKKMQNHIHRSSQEKNELTVELSRLRESISEMRLNQPFDETFPGGQDQGRDHPGDVSSASISQHDLRSLPEQLGSGRRSKSECTDDSLLPDRVAQLEKVVNGVSDRLQRLETSEAILATASATNLGTEISPHTSSRTDNPKSAPSGVLEVVEETTQVLPVTPDVGQCVSDATVHLHNVSPSEVRLGPTDHKAVTQFRDVESEAVKHRSFTYSKDDYLSTKDNWLLREQMYAFKGSAWDVGMLTLVPRMTVVNSAVVLFIFVLNAFAQNCLTVSIYVNFVGTEIDNDYVSELRDWRLTVAHDVRWMDAVTQQSLARKVCNEGGAAGGLYMSGNVQDALAQVLQYLPVSTFLKPSEGFFQKTLVDSRPEWIGMFMCVMALLIWWNRCYLELKDWLDCCEGVFRLPRGEHTRIFALEGTEDIALSSMSFRRKTWCVFVLLNRFVVGVALLYVGSMYLLHTLNLRDLILNAVALDLVLQLDELLYDSFVPFHVRHFLHCLEPVPRIMGRCFIKNFQYEVLITCSVMVGLGVWASFVLARQASDLDNARDAICGGYLDFVYTIDPGGAIVATPTYAPKSGSDIPKVSNDRIAGRVGSLGSSYQLNAIKELVDNWRAVTLGPEQSLSDGAAALSGSRLSLIERRAIPVGKRMAELNPNCADLSVTTSRMVWPQAFIVNMIREPLAEVGITSITDSICVDAKRMCNWDNETGIILRKWCAHSCGCNLPNSSLILSRNTQGCPNPCASSKAYEEGLDNAVCADRPTSSPAFQEYVHGFRKVAESYSQTVGWSSKFSGWILALESSGCAAHNLGVFGDLCSSVNAFDLKPLHHICPITCGCDHAPSFGLTSLPGDQAELCPRSCANFTTDHYHQPTDMSLHHR